MGHPEGAKRLKGLLSPLAVETTLDGQRSFRRFAPQDDTPGRFAPQDDTPRRFAPQDNTPRRFAPEDDTPGRFAPRDDTPRRSAPQVTRRVGGNPFVLPGYHFSSVIMNYSRSVP